jgi:hypothetical protein
LVFKVLDLCGELMPGSVEKATHSLLVWIKVLSQSSFRLGQNSAWDFVWMISRMVFVMFRSGAELLYLIYY